MIFGRHCLYHEAYSSSCSCYRTRSQFFTVSSQMISGRFGFPNGKNSEVFHSVASSASLTQVRGRPSAAGSVGCDDGAPSSYDRETFLAVELSVVGIPQLWLAGKVVAVRVLLHAHPERHGHQSYFRRQAPVETQHTVIYRQTKTTYFLKLRYNFDTTCNHNNVVGNDVLRFF